MDNAEVASTEETVVNSDVNTQLEMQVEDTVSITKLKEAQRQAQLAEAKAQKLMSELETHKKAQMKSTGDLKAYAETLEKEVESIRKERDMTWQWIENDKKMSEIKVQAVAHGMRKEALDMLAKMDFDDVVLEKTTTGRMNVLGADRAVARLKSQMPFLFEQKSVKVNAESPATTGAQNKITYEEIRKLQDQAKKTGDWSSLEKALVEYKKQNAI